MALVSAALAGSLASPLFAQERTGAGTSQSVSEVSADPLQTLRRRSPESRWKSIATRWKVGTRKGADSAENETATASTRPGSVQRARSAKTPDRILRVQGTAPAPAPAPRADVLPQIENGADGAGVAPAQNPAPRGSATLSKPLLEIRTPSQLKRVTEILPQFDYRPDYPFHGRTAEDILAEYDTSGDERLSAEEFAAALAGAQEIRVERQFNTLDEDKNGLLTATELDPCAYLCPNPIGGTCLVDGEDGSGRLCPDEVRLSAEPFQTRMHADMVYHWSASNLHHNPLYFEDFALERYGHTYPDWLQPAVSVGLFSTQLIGLPYQMTLHPPCSKEYTLGWYRPGECTPKLHYQIPLNLEAAAVQAGVVGGLIWMIP